MTKSLLVFDRDKNQIIKTCRTLDEYKRELHIYQKNLAFTPTLYSHSQKEFSITISHLNGHTLYNTLNPDFGRIAKLFHQLHSLEEKTICLMDTNPNNFIYDFGADRYYMLDFSEWEYNQKEFDLIHFLLFWAAIYDEEKFTKTAVSFLDSYNKLNNIETSVWNRMLPIIINMFDERRNKYRKKEKLKNVDQEANRELLKKWFKKE